MNHNNIYLPAAQLAEALEEVPWDDDHNPALPAAFAALADILRHGGTWHIDDRGSWIQIEHIEYTDPDPWEDLT